MNILIDNKDLKSYFGITCLDWTAALGFASTRPDALTWADKSGIDRNLENGRFDAKEFALPCIVSGVGNEGEAYAKINTLVEYMLTKRVFVLSLRDDIRGVRECFLCMRSTAIISNINISGGASLYAFKLGLKDVNPNALKYKTAVVGNEATIAYNKGQTSVIYWGDGSRGSVSNSGNYAKSNYAEDTLIDIIIDIDKDADIITPLLADFEADITEGIKEQDVQFTDLSTGIVEIWSWDFGDGFTSSEQNPFHTYTQDGIYTVTLQIFNAAKGSAVETKINYINIRNARMLVNDSGDFALRNNSGDYGLIN